jgi:hypothetical protein
VVFWPTPTAATTHVLSAFLCPVFVPSSAPQQFGCRPVLLVLRRETLLVPCGVLEASPNLPQLHQKWALPSGHASVQHACWEWGTRACMHMCECAGCGRTRERHASGVGIDVGPTADRPSLQSLQPPAGRGQGLEGGEG